MKAIRPYYILAFLALSLLASAKAHAQDGILRGGTDSPFGNDRRQEPDTSRVKRQLGQLLNDSVQQVYGPHTTLYFTAESWRWEEATLSNPDTLLDDLHRYNYIAREGYRLQNLSAIASPAHPLFYQAPEQVGARLGIDALNYLLPSPETWRFYNTRSPYSYWQYVQGGGGRSYLDAAYSRNINPRSNFGFIYRRVISKPLVGLRNLPGNERQVDHQNILLHGNYTSPNGRYRIASYFSSYRQNLQETGGLNSQEASSLDTLFTLERGQLVNRISSADGNWKGMDWYGQQSYQPFDSVKLRVFHEWRIQSVEHGYTDPSPNASEIYPNNYFNSSATEYRSLFQELDTRIGLRWRRKGIFLSAHYRLRTPRWAQQTVRGQQISNALPLEHYLGGKVALSIKDLFTLKGEVEYLLFTEYKLKALLLSKWLEVSLEQQRFRPSIASIYRYGNHFLWQNNFQSSFSTDLSAKLKLALGNKIELRPQARLLNIADLVYWGEDARPQQLGQAANLFQGGVELEGRLGEYWGWKALALYTANNQEQAMPVPELFANAQVYYERTFFQGNLPAQIGLDFHWHSAYYAYDYQPLLRQFHVQSEYQVGNYPLLEAFVNAHIGRVMLFAKGTNLLQGLGKEGYYLTPRYMAQPRQFEFGLIWRFFD